MRKPLSDKLNMDLTKPLNKEDINIKHDCFGKEYLPADANCAICAVHEVCGILHTDRVKRMAKTVTKKTEKFIDEWSFDKIPRDKILGLIKSNPLKYTTEDIHEVVKSKSKCEDQKTTILWLKNFILDNGLGTADGKIYVK